MDIPVFLFTGFLDGGKTTFIQSLLMDKEFNKGQTILVLQCEEGEEELDLSKLPGNTRVFTESIDEEDALSEELLLRLQKKYKPTRNWCFLTGSQSRQTRWLCTKSSGQYPVNAI